MSTKEKVYQFIKSLIIKYGEAFPSFPTIAKVAGCSSRHATDLVKQLEEDGRIRKEHRFTEEDGRRRQLSNRYEIVEEAAEEIPAIQEEKPSSSPYIKAFKRSLIKSLTDDDLKENYRYREFFEIAKEWSLSDELAAEIFEHIREYLPKMKSWVSLYWSLNRMKEYADTISSVGPWFLTTLRRRDHMLNFQISR